MYGLHTTGMTSMIRLSQGYNDSTFILGVTNFYLLMDLRQFNRREFMPGTINPVNYYWWLEK